MNEAKDKYKSYLSIQNISNFVPNLRSYQDTPTKLSQFAHETLATTEKPNFNQIKKIK